MAGFDPYDKGSGGLDLDQLLRGCLAFLQILTGVFGVVALITAFVLALEVFEFIGTFVNDPDRIASYIEVLKQEQTLLPPVEAVQEASAEPASSDGTKPPKAIKLAMKAEPMSNADVFERTADRVVLFFLMGLYAIIPLGMGLIGLKIIVAMISRKPAPKSKEVTEPSDEDEEADAPSLDSELPRRIG